MSRLMSVWTLALAGCGPEALTVRQSPNAPLTEVPPDYTEAADAGGAPAALLLALSKVETGMQMVVGEVEFPDQAPAYGVMALRGENLARGATLAGLDAETVRTERWANVLAASHLLSAWADEAGIDRTTLGAWAPVVVRYAQLSEEAAAEYVHYDVFWAIRNGIEGEGFLLAGQAVAPDWDEPARGAVPPSGQRARDPSAVWTPSPNYSSRSGAAVDFLVVHSCEGGYSGCWSTLTTSGTGVSAHYVVKEDGSEVRQMVDEDNKAWHISANYDCDNNSQVECWRDGAAMNSVSVGIEHAGFASGTWQAGLVTRSAELACAITDRHGIVRDSYHIVGHGQLQPWNRTDPGANWPWASYLAQIDTACGDGGGTTTGDDDDDDDGGGTGTAFIIDSNNGANDTSRYFTEVSASWRASANVSGYYNTGYWYGATDAVSDPASFWFHETSEACYQVDAWWPAASDRPPAIAWLGWTDDDVEVGRATVDQTRNGARWNLLGHWRFPAGWNRVVLSRWATKGDNAVADAVRLTPSSSCP